MLRETLEMLMAKVAAVTGQDRVIAGSHSANGQIGWLPGPVLQSIEADFLLPRFGPSLVIDDDCGPELAEHGVYADPLDAGLIALRRGWEQRLFPIKDDQGKPSWWALKIHDTAASKLMAGRGKDIDFNIKLTSSQAFRFDICIKTSFLLLESSCISGLHSRVQKPVKRQRTAKRHDLDKKAADLRNSSPA